MRRFLFLTYISLFGTNAFALPNNTNDYQLFNAIFSQWTTAFNHQDQNASCALFSKNVTANYQGVATKNYDSICNGFKKVFNDTTKKYLYDYKLHEIYRTQDLAAVRITWYLSILENGKVISKTKDEGLDVFQKQNTGQWKIVNYLGYPAS